MMHYARSQRRKLKAESSSWSHRYAQSLSFVLLTTVMAALT